MLKDECFVILDKEENFGSGNLHEKSKANKYIYIDYDWLNLNKCSTMIIVVDDNIYDYVN